MMATKHKQVMQNGTSKENNALQRILRLPVVNSACNSLRKTYATTKEAHPLVASLCTAYERGLQSASSLAAWSMRPVVQKLEPQFAVANVLACQGLDHLEQKIPALHKPLEEVTSDLKESVLTQIQKSIHIIVGILNKAMGAENNERPKNSVKATVEYARSSRVSQVAEAGAEAVTGKMEKLMDFFLPKEETQAACGPPGTSVSKEISPSTTFGKVTALATSVSQHAYKQTVQTIQLLKDKGQELATWIPGLDHLARQSKAKIQWMLSSGWNTATGWLRKGQRRLQKKEDEAKKKDDQTAKSAELQGTMGRVAQNLHTAYLSTILLVKNAPFIAWNTAGQLLHVSTHKAVSEAGAKVGILQGIVGKLLGTIIHYVPLPNVLEEEEETVTTDQVEPSQEEEDAWLVATLRLQERRRSSRGHYPIPFINLDDPPEEAPSQRHRNPAFEAEYTGSRKSAFSPYKGAGRRRWSEGLFRFPPEVTYTRAQHTGLYSTTPKKD